MSNIHDERRKAIRAFATERYILTGEDSTVAEIAAGIGVSASAVRATIDHFRGCIEGLVPRQEWRTSYSKSYRMMESGLHRVWTYGPDRCDLRKIIQGMRATQPAT